MACVIPRTLIKTCVLTLPVQAQTSVQMAQGVATIDITVALIKANRGQIIVKHQEFKSWTLQKPRQNLWRSSTFKTWSSSTTKQAVALHLKLMGEPVQWLNKPCLSQPLIRRLQLPLPNAGAIIITRQRSRSKVRKCRPKLVLRGLIVLVVCTERLKALLHQR